MDWDLYLDDLIDIIRKINMKEVTVLTGGNGRGKSFIRKCLWQHVNQVNNIIENKSYVSDTSMERRTGLHAEMGGAGIFCRDTEWTPTSLNTFDYIKGVLKSDGRYIVIDELELGMSEEFQLSVVDYINNIKDEVLSKNYGILIITHSKTVVSNINSDNFLNLEGMTKEEWINREIKPIDIEKLEKESLELHHAILERLKSVK